MGSQVQQLEELLSNVQRNRARMEALGPSGRRRAVAVAQTAENEVLVGTEEAVDVEPAAAEIGEEPPEEVIDLVNPTRTADMAADMGDETDFSDVTPVSNEPAPVAPDTSSFAPASAAPLEDETDFSSASVPSVVPLAPDDVEEIDDVSSYGRDELADDVSLTSEVETSVTTPMTDDTRNELADELEPDTDETETDDEEEAEELELVNSDIEDAPVSVAVAPPIEEASVAISDYPSQDNRDVSVSKVELTSRTFDTTAVASGSIVETIGAVVEKSWTISDVLARAWRLGSKE
ncbi:MAG: hypothetical protein JXX29_22125 [Deltaproteobacteria bacterium]|nr:hypothetical protein [Deltaproteobacteria bacterium]MBN2674394.1 hypothetical protein [Deltaproteobacteria bacterium]